MLKWWRRRRDEKARAESGDNLPFSAEEFADLIRSGNKDDLKRLAAGLGDPRKVRRPL